MRKTEKYYCDLCDKGFDTEEECKEHEITHFANWGEAASETIVEELRQLPDYHGYRAERIDRTFLRHFAADFVNLMYKVTKRTEEE